MLPTLSDFGIEAPAYIRKLDKLTDWNPEGYTLIEEKVEAIAGKVFRSPSHIYSTWQVSTQQELYGIVSALTEFRNPKKQDLDFIWFTGKELEENGLIPQNVPEGSCLHVCNLHFNIQIEPSAAKQLCEYLIGKARKAKRLGRNKHTGPILEHQEQLGCRAVSSQLATCDCEKW